MLKSRMIYVVDTNVLVDYVDIIQSYGFSAAPEEATIDLSDAHLVIPTAVIRELSSFKNEKTARGKAARVALDRIRRIVETHDYTMKEAYNLKRPIRVPGSEQVISILPVHKSFKNSLPFNPSDDDMDGQIILATLTVTFRSAELPIDGTTPVMNIASLDMSGVVLLTNDNGLAIRARQRGIKTSRYGYKYPKPYTGRRDITVSYKLFSEFYKFRRIDRELFEELAPNECSLVANEFVIMHLEEGEEYPEGYDPDNDMYYSYIGRYDREEDAIVPLSYATSFPTYPENAGQAIYAEALMNPKFAAIICAGPAGSGKTYMATVYGYHACKSGKFIGVTAVPCESRSRLGALPGDLDEKMDPDVQPLKNALRNYLLKEDSSLKKELDVLRKFGTDKKYRKNSRMDDSDEDYPEKRSIKAKLKDRVDLIWDNWFTSIPIENARGRDFSHELAIYDEFQDQNSSQADTLIKRIGDEGKIILTGDVEQIHAPYLDRSNNGLVYAARQLYDNPMVAQVCFIEDEVIRHPLVKLIAKRQKARRTK